VAGAANALSVLDGSGGATMVRRIALTLLVVFAAGCSPSRTAPEPQATSPSTSTSLVPSPIASASGWLAYQSLTASGDGVFLVRVDGSENHQIVTDLPGNLAHPDFSRDGKRLAVDQLTSEESPSHVYVANADGANARRLPPACCPSAPATRSPPGRRTAGGLRSPPTSTSGRASRRSGLASRSSTSPRGPSGRWSRTPTRPGRTCSPAGRRTGAGWCSGVTANAPAASRRRCSWSTSTAPGCGS
jgi:hypothetical protein